MAANDMDAEALLLDHTYFALDAKGFAAFQDMLDNPPATTDRLRRTLTSQTPWDAKGAAMGKATGYSRK